MAPDSLPWLVYPPAVDLANMVIAGPDGERDLLATDHQLRSWVAAERGRIPDVESAITHPDDVRALRDDVLGLLRARAEGVDPPTGPRRRLNLASAAGPVKSTLTPDGRAVEQPAAKDPFRRFAATVARSAIQLADRSEERLKRCSAPSCGMLFVQGHPRQLWCSKECGNRARVARHAARHRRS
jgi:predicted RNA-binding Zn ribbon-like protein